MTDIPDDLLDEVERARIYVASKTRHAPMWQRMRDLCGYRIISTWIDEAGVGDTQDWPDLWVRCIREASQADILMVYAETGDILKGAWVEVGAALASGKPVIGVGCDGYSIRHHPLFHSMTLSDALTRLRAAREKP